MRDWGSLNYFTSDENGKNKIESFDCRSHPVWAMVERGRLFIMTFRAIPRTVVLALILTLVLIAWIATGGVLRFDEDTPPPAVQPEAAPIRVQAQWLDAVEYAPKLSVQGQIEPWQHLELGARVSGTVERLPAAIGESVQEGQVIAELSIEDRAVQISRFEAEVRQREGELAAAQRLRSSQMQSETGILRLTTELARARADLAAARLEFAHTRPEAPFDAVVDRHLVEIGDYVQPGTPLVRLVAVDRLKVTGQVPQQSIAPIEIGQEVDVDLLDGRRLVGSVHFIASAADPDSRSFRIEVAVPNPERLRIAGGSATLGVHLAPLMAHRVSPALLSLDQEGRLGVWRLDEEDRIRFGPVRLLSADNDVAWLAGLPDRVRLVTRGAGFADPGQQVVPVDSPTPDP